MPGSVGGRGGKLSRPTRPVGPRTSRNEPPCISWAASAEIEMQFSYQEIALLKGIHEHPRDEARRLVYADWCEENGLGEYAEFTRLDILAKEIFGRNLTREANYSRWGELNGFRHTYLNS